MNKNEKGIIINDIDVLECCNYIFEYFDGRVKRINVCECGIQGVEFYNMMCSDNPECYYKQLQREKQKNEILINEIEAQNDLDDKLMKDNNVLHETLKEIEEIAKASIYTPSCFNHPDCPINGGAGFDDHCYEYCPILIINKILEKTKEAE